jgi:serine/threonine protein kinase
LDAGDACAEGAESALKASDFEMEGAQLKSLQKSGEKGPTFSKADIQAAADVCESGRWRVTEYIASGPFGDTYRARDTLANGKTVVLEANFQHPTGYKPLADSAPCTSGPAQELLKSIAAGAAFSDAEKQVIREFVNQDHSSEEVGHPVDLPFGGAGMLGMAQEMMMTAFETLLPANKRWGAHSKQVSMTAMDSIENTCRCGGEDCSCAHGACSRLALRESECTPGGAGPVLLTVMPDGGRTLSEITKGGKKMPDGKTRKIMSDVLRGLCVLHQHGVAHRDVKLGNIVWNAETGVARLTNFDSAISSTVQSEHAQDIFAAGATYLRLLDADAFVATFGGEQHTQLNATGREQLNEKFLDVLQPAVEDDKVPIEKMMSSDSGLRPTACELLQMPPFSTMPLPSAEPASKPDLLKHLQGRWAEVQDALFRAGKLGA